VTRAPLISRTERSEQAALWAVRLADGESSSEPYDAFEAWLDADPENGKAFREILGTWDAVETYSASAEVVALREAALASARRTLGRTARPALRWVPLGLVAAAVLVISAIGLASWAWLTPRVYETGVGERRVVALSDGSKLSLDADTVVKVSYSRADRKLWLERGRARFEVAHNPLRPFSVTAADEVVVATGTAFSVELVQRQVRVVLYEGRVMLLDRDGVGQRRTVSMGPRIVPADQLLAPGRELILPATASVQLASIPAVVTPLDPVRSLSWEAGQLVFEDESLGAVVERMNRYTDRPLKVGDARAAAVRVSGVFRAGDSDALVQGLAAAFDIKVRSGPDGIVLFGGGEGQRLD
jgi:transmembrane sensor